MTNLYALIVGIEKYDLPRWNRSGPVAGAIEMAYWCNSIGMPYKNIHMFLSVNDEDASWEKERKDQLGHFKKSGAKIVEDSKLGAIDTFWRESLPKIANGDSKLLVYWCGHGVTRSDRDRVLLHTDFLPDNLSNRVTSAGNLVASLTTQTYRRFKEQLIVADVCGDFSSYSVSPNTHPPMKPVDSITQHCYFATVDGQPTQIQNGIGQFTQSTLEVLKQYSDWPNLDDLKTRMDEKFPKGSNRPFKISIWTPGGKDDENNAYAFIPSISGSIPSSSATLPIAESLESLIRECEQAFINDLWDDLFDKVDGFIPMLSSVGTRYRNELVVFRRDFKDNRASWRIKSINDEDYKVAKTSLWIRVREMLYSVREDLKASQSKKNANEISIPSTDKNASTVTSDSEISSSPPSVPPKNPLEFFRLQIDNLLKGNDEITKNFYNLLASDEKKVKSDVVADHLVRLDDSNSTEYPLLRLRRLMKKLSDQKLTLDHSYRTIFVSMMDILSVASFPDEDRDRMENAMVEVLRSNPEIGAKIQLSTALPEDVKRLLILTRLKLAAKKFDDFAIDRILNNDYQEGESGSPLFEIVRPVIISEPFILPPDGRSITAYYAEKILESFNSTMPRTDFEGCLTHELKERKGSDGDGEVIALLLSNEASKNAQILQKAFPLLLVIVLERENALRYDTVLLDRNEIEKFLKKILRNPQK